MYMCRHLSKVMLKVVMRIGIGMHGVLHARYAGK